MEFVFAEERSRENRPTAVRSRSRLIRALAVLAITVPFVGSVNILHSRADTIIEQTKTSGTIAVSYAGHLKNPASSDSTSSDTVNASYTLNVENSPSTISLDANETPALSIPFEDNVDLLSYATISDFNFTEEDWIVPNGPIDPDGPQPCADNITVAGAPTLSLDEYHSIYALQDQFIEGNLPAFTVALADSASETSCTNFNASDLQTLGEGGFTMSNPDSGYASELNAGVASFEYVEVFSDSPICTGNAAPSDFTVLKGECTFSEHGNDGESYQTMTVDWDLQTGAPGPVDRSLPTVGDTQAGGNPDAPDSGCACGDPVQTATGEFFSRADDVRIPGRGVELDLARTYSSTSTVSSRFGNGWLDSYGESLTTTGPTTVAVMESNGGSVPFTSGNGNWVAPTNYNASLIQNDDGTWSFTRATGVSLNFSTAGRLASESDRDGYVTTLDYNGAGELISVVDPAGRQLQFKYTDGRITKTIDPMGRSLAYAYDIDGDLTSVADRAGDVTTYTYASDHRLTATTDARNHTTKIAYDSDGRVTSTMDPLGNQTGYAYSSAFADSPATVTTVTSPRGVVQQFDYQNLQLMAQTVNPGTATSATTTYTWDPVTGSMATSTDPLGNTTSYIYDTGRNVLSKTDPLGNVSSYIWDSEHDLLTATDPTGVTATYTYDSRGNLTSTSVPDSTDSSTLITTYTYDPSRPGDLISATNPLKHTTRYSFDSTGQLISRTDPTGDRTTGTFDPDGEQLTLTAPRGNASGAATDSYTTHYSYDRDGRELTSTDPLGRVSTTGYDAAGNIIKQTDPTKTGVATTYDANNRPTVVTRVSSTGKPVSKESSAYDADGDLASTTDGSGHVTRYTYDALDRLAKTSVASQPATSYTYDADSDPVTITDQIGHKQTNRYDADGELTNTSFTPAGTAAVAYSYDPDGRVIGTDDGTGTTTYTYDSLGELLNRTDGAGNTVAYHYDHDGNTVRLTYANGKAINQTFDTDGRLTAVKDWLGKTTKFAYNADGDLIKTALPNKTAVNAAVDANGDTTTISDATTGKSSKTLLKLTDTRTTAGLLGSETTSGIALPAAKTTYSRDAAERLTGATVTPATSTSSTFAYTGNDSLADSRIMTSKATTSTAYSYASTSALTKTVTATTSTTYTADAAGERTKATRKGSSPFTATYTWNAAGRLIRYVKGSTVATYSYDAAGLRVSKKVGTTTSHLTYDTTSSVPALLTDGAASYLYGPDGNVFEQINGTTPNYLTHDQLGSTRLLTSKTGAAVGTYRYSPYGTPTHTGTASTLIEYAGALRDSESGLYDLNARYYDSATAEFLSRDPLYTLTGQAYSYAKDAPTDATDPSGLLCIHNICTRFDPGAGLDAIVNIGRGATGGVTDDIVNVISPGASCTVAQNEVDKGIGETAVAIATAGVGAEADAAGEAGAAGGDPFGDFTTDISAATSATDVALGLARLLDSGDGSALLAGLRAQGGELATRLGSAVNNIGMKAARTAIAQGW